MVVHCKVGRSHKLATAHLQAPERQIGYCTPMKTVAYKKFNNNTLFQSVARPLMLKPREGCREVSRSRGFAVNLDDSR